MPVPSKSIKSPKHATEGRCVTMLPYLLVVVGNMPVLHAGQGKQKEHKKNVKRKLNLGESKVTNANYTNMKKDKEMETPASHMVGKAVG